MTPILFALNFIACQATHINQTKPPEKTENLVNEEKEGPKPTLDDYLESLCDAIGICDAIIGDGKLCDKICDEICSPISAEELQKHLKKDCEKV